jgi:hypothetical protein
MKDKVIELDDLKKIEDVKVWNVTFVGSID